MQSMYDTDCTTWSSQGKLFQVEYACEAVKLGSICVGLKSKNAVVLVTFRKPKSDLAGLQEKLFMVDDHIGMAVSGLISDARVICKWMRNECLNHKYVYESPHPFGRLLQKFSEKSQLKTQRHNKRPYGVGLLVAGVDQDGPHLYETSPTGLVLEYHAYSIGGRSQSARTYLENNFERFPSVSSDRLILHGIKAISTSLQDAKDLTAKGLELAIVETGKPFRIIGDEEKQAFLEQLREFNPEADVMEIEQ